MRVQLDYSSSPGRRFETLPELSSNTRQTPEPSHPSDQQLKPSDIFPVKSIHPAVGSRSRLSATSIKVRYRTVSSSSCHSLTICWFPCKCSINAQIVQVD